MFLFNIASRAATRSHAILLTSAAVPGDDRDLRRYDTVIPPGMSAPMPDAASDDQTSSSSGDSSTSSFAAAAVSAAELAAAHAEAEAAAMRAAAVEAAAAELAGKVSRLRAMLAERDAADDEGARVQRAVQRQEEEDSLKMIALLRAQDEAFASELAEAKASVEAATVRAPFPGPRSTNAFYRPILCSACYPVPPCVPSLQSQMHCVPSLQSQMLQHEACLLASNR